MGYGNKWSATLFICCIFQHIPAQENGMKKLTIDGYFSNLQTVIDIDSLKGYWLYQSQIHNRINLNYYPSQALSASLQLRNRFIIGDQIRMDLKNAYKNSLRSDIGVLDLSCNLASGKSYVLNTIIDRLWLKYTLDKIEITFGRQRINWGQTFVWNPNDWFNTYSFFDFDYEERPGSDGLRIAYYTGPTSSLEAAVTADSAKRITAAARYKMNALKYDFQLLGGVLAGKDAAIGFGWAGGIGNIGFRGEFSYFRPLNHFADTSALVLLSVSLDYTFSNSLMVQFEGFYGQIPGLYEGKSFTEFYNRPLSVKDLSFTPWNFFGQVSYPITPLLNGGISAIYYPDVKGYYVGPNVTYSLAPNFDFSIFLQVFSGNFPDAAGKIRRQVFGLGFIRFKYNF
jgi:hypothetical protein